MNKIKDVLDARNISQTKLAERLGKSFNIVNLYALIKFNLLYPFYIKLQTF